MSAPFPINLSIIFFTILTKEINKLLLKNRKALLFYNIYWSLLASQFLAEPCFICQITSFIRQYRCSAFGCSGSTHARSPVGCLHKWSVHHTSMNGGYTSPARVPRATWTRCVTGGAGAGGGQEEVKSRSRLYGIIWAQS